MLGEIQVNLYVGYDKSIRINYNVYNKVNVTLEGV